MIVQNEKKGKEALQNPMKEYARLPFLFYCDSPMLRESLVREQSSLL